MLVFEAMATFIGQVSVLSLIALFGAATTAMVTSNLLHPNNTQKNTPYNFLTMILLQFSQITTARKAVTLLLSYLIFTKPLTEQHGSGLILITMGIVLKLVLDSKPAPRVSRVDSTTAQERSQWIEVNRRNGNRESGEEDEEKRPLV